MSKALTITTTADHDALTDALVGVRGRHGARACHRAQPCRRRLAVNGGSSPVPRRGPQHFLAVPLPDEGCNIWPMGGNRSRAKPFKVDKSSLRQRPFDRAAKTFPITATDARRIEEFVATIPTAAVASRITATGRFASPNSRADTQARRGQGISVRPMATKPTSRRRSGKASTKRKASTRSRASARGAAKTSISRRKRSRAKTSKRRLVVSRVSPT